MDLIDFPFVVGVGGRLRHSAGPEDSIAKLLGVMARTPRRGWRGAGSFGLRDALAELQSRHDARLFAIKQMNEALQELEIDWVRVDDIRCEPAEAHRASYVLTLSYAGKGTETHRLVL